MEVENTSVNKSPDNDVTESPTKGVSESQSQGVSESPAKSVSENQDTDITVTNVSEGSSDFVRIKQEVDLPEDDTYYPMDFGISVEDDEETNPVYVKMKNKEGASSGTKPGIEESKSQEEEDDDEDDSEMSEGESEGESDEDSSNSRGEASGEEAANTGWSDGLPSEETQHPSTSGETMPTLIDGTPIVIKEEPISDDEGLSYQKVGEQYAENYNMLESLRRVCTGDAGEDTEDTGQASQGLSYPKDGEQFAESYRMLESLRRESNAGEDAGHSTQGTMFNSNLSPSKICMDGIKQEQTEIFNCEICGDVFEGNGDLESHQQVAHTSVNGSIPVIEDGGERGHVQVDDQVLPQEEVVRVEVFEGNIPVYVFDVGNQQLHSQSELEGQQLLDPLNIPETMLRASNSGSFDYSTCRLCKKACGNRRIYLTHLRIKHNDELSFECKVCKAKYLDQEELEWYKGSHIGQVDHNSGEDYLRCEECGNETSYVCHTCDMEFDNRPKLITHQKVHSKGRKRYCHMCDMYFKDIRETREHLGTHFPMPGKTNQTEHLTEETNSRVKVGKGGRNPQAFHDTLRTLQQEEYAFKCEICLKAFDFWRDFTSHRKIHISDGSLSENKSAEDSAVDNSTNHLHQCIFCNEKFDMKTLFEHPCVYITRGIRQCPICRRRASGRKNFRRHVSQHGYTQALANQHVDTESMTFPSHVLIPGQTYRCAWCKKEFQDLGKLVDHTRIHISYGRNQCPVCKHMYSCMHYFRLHLKEHGVIAPFGDRSYNMSHVGPCPPEEQNRCKWCAEEFESAHDLVTHNAMHIQHKGKNRCPVCGMWFGQWKAASFRTHLKTHNVHVLAIYSNGWEFFETEGARAPSQGSKKGRKEYRKDKSNYTPLDEPQPSSKSSLMQYSDFGTQPWKMPKNQAVKQGSKPKHSCPWCNEVFYYPQALGNHINVHLTSGMNRCFFCLKWVDGVLNFKRHLTDHGMLISNKRKKPGGLDTGGGTSLPQIDQARDQQSSKHQYDVHDKIKFQQLIGSLAESQLAKQSQSAEEENIVTPLKEPCQSGKTSLESHTFGTERDIETLHQVSDERTNITCEPETVSGRPQDSCNVAQVQNPLTGTATHSGALTEETCSNQTQPFQTSASELLKYLSKEICPSTESPKPGSHLVIGSSDGDIQNSDISCKRIHHANDAQMWTEDSMSNQAQQTSDENGQAGLHTSSNPIVSQGSEGPQQQNAAAGVDDDATLSHQTPQTSEDTMSLGGPPEHTPTSRKYSQGFQCNYCKKIFTTARILKDHTPKCKENPQGFKFKCDYCKQKLRNSRKLRDHQRAHIFYCYWCKKSYRGPGRLVRHHESHHQGKKFVVEFFDHGKGKKQICTYQCEICYQHFILSTKYHEHKKLHALRSAETIQESLKNVGDVAGVSSEDHNLPDKRETPTPNSYGTQGPNGDQTCGGKPLNKPFLCSETHRSTEPVVGTFGKVSELSEKKRNITCEPDTVSPVQTLSCEWCKMSFSDPNELEHHHAGVHVSWGGNRCPICEKWYSDPKVFQRHLKIHGVIIPTLKYQAQVSLVETTIQEWQNSCKWCNEVFDSLESLNAHVRSHIPKQKSRCPVCGMAFHSGPKMSFEAHLRTHGITMYDFRTESIQLDPRNEMADTGFRLKRKGSSDGDIENSDISCKRIHLANDAQTWTEDSMSNQAQQTSDENGQAGLHTSSNPLVLQGSEKGPQQQNAPAGVDDDVTLHVCHETPQISECTMSLAGLPENTPTSEKYSQGFKCNYCKKNFTWARTLEIHTPKCRENPQGYKFQCDYCKQKFINRRKFRHHQRSHTFHCYWCKKSFRGAARLVSHHKSYHQGKKFVAEFVEPGKGKKQICMYQCEICYQPFVLSTKYHEHKKLHASRSAETIKESLEMAGDVAGVSSEAHNLSDKKGIPGPISKSTCSISQYGTQGPNGDKTCGGMPLNKPNLRSKTHRSTEPVIGTFGKVSDLSEEKKNLTCKPDIVSPDQTLSCAWCKMSFSDPNELGHHHARVHVSWGKNRCPICEKWYCVLLSFQQHLSSHGVIIPTLKYQGQISLVETTIQDWQNCCNWCNEEFDSFETLNAHVCSHIPRRKTRCLVCGMRFTSDNQRASYNSHLETHGITLPHSGWIPVDSDNEVSDQRFHVKGQEPPEHAPISEKHPQEFKCDHCKKKFTTAGKLGDHIPKCRWNPQDFKYQCDYCKKKFAKVKKLRNHLQFHVFACYWCKKNYVNKARLRIHHEYYHPGKPFVTVLKGPKNWNNKRNASSSAQTLNESPEMENDVRALSEDHNGPDKTGSPATSREFPSSQEYQQGMEKHDAEKQSSVSSHFEPHIPSPSSKDHHQGIEKNDAENQSNILSHFEPHISSQSSQDHQQELENCDAEYQSSVLPQFEPHISVDPSDSVEYAAVEGPSPISSSDEQSSNYCLWCAKDLSSLPIKKQVAHEQTHIAKGRNRCPICRTWLPTGDGLRTHLQVHGVIIPPEEKKKKHYHKFAKQKKSLSIQDRKSTCLMPAASRVQSSVKAQKYRCAWSNCNHKEFVDKEKLIDHTHVHISKRSNRCPVCRKVYSKTRRYLKHLKKHGIIAPNHKEFRDVEMVCVMNDEGKIESQVNEENIGNDGWLEELNPDIDTWIAELNPGIGGCLDDVMPSQNLYQSRDTQNLIQNPTSETLTCAGTSSDHVPQDCPEGWTILDSTIGDI